MIHIKRTQSGFTVTTHSSTSGDNEILSSSGKQTFARMAGVWKNIRAQMKEWNSEFVYVQDDTKPPRARVFILTFDDNDKPVLNPNHGRVAEFYPQLRKNKVKKTK